MNRRPTPRGPNSPGACPLARPVNLRGAALRARAEEENMPDLKLARLPDRAPVKLTLSLMPEPHDRLTQYADLYHEAYGHAETVADLVPVMLGAFMDGDRAFMRRRAGS